MERRLAAVLSADVAGYSRLMGEDETGTLAAVKACFDSQIDPKIAKHSGRTVKLMGDGALVEFPSVVEAVACAAEIQRAMVERNAEVNDGRPIELRIGINVGDIIIEGDDIFGDGVNIAARLQAIANPGGICISRAVRDQVRGKLDLAFVDGGERELKNIARPVRVFHVQTDSVSVGGSSLPTHPAVPTERLSIIVLPFANLSSDPEQEYLADAIVEDLTTDLSRLQGSFVIARSTAFTYKGKAVNAKQLGKELGVHYMLEGSVRRLGNQVRVNAQLIDTQTGGHLWAERFDGDVSNLLALQDVVTANLASTLGLRMVEAAARYAAHQNNPDVVDLVMRGRGAALRPRTRESLAEASDFYQQALKLAPHSAEALTGLAEILASGALSLISQDPGADLERADELVSRALVEHPESAWAHYVKGEVRRGQHRMEDAAREYEEAVAFHQNFAPAIANLALTKIMTGRPGDAIPLLEQAIRMSPRDPLLAIWHSRIGLAEIYLEHYERATAMLEIARSLNPDLPWGHFYLAGAYALIGKIENAKASLAEARRLSPDLNSLANYRSISQMTHPDGLALREETLARGLRLAGLPED